MEEKTYVMGNDNSTLAAMIPALTNNNPALTAALMNNKDCMGGNGWWIIILLMALWGRNGFGSEQVNPVLQQLGSDSGREMIMSAVNGNASALNQLASTLNCDMTSLTAALNSIRESGNSLAALMASGCCDIKNSITTQGYENRLANAEQTAILGAKIDNQTNVINDKFCAAEMREMQNKLAALQDHNTQLQNSISNANQTAQIQAMIAPLQAAIAEIKAATPSTVSVPYPQLTAVPTSQLYGYYPYQGTMWS